MRNLVRGAVLLLMLAVAGCAAGKGGSKAARPVESPSAGVGQEILAIEQTPTPIAVQMAGKTGILTLTVTEGGFQPPIIAAKAGGQVRIHLRNGGRAGHNLVIPRYGIATRTLGPGEETYVEFTAGEKGDWPVFSDAPGAPEVGLTGHLRVE